MMRTRQSMQVPRLKPRKVILARQPKLGQGEMHELGHAHLPAGQSIPSAAILSSVTGGSGTFWIQYDIQDELGEGAFGKAYRARRRRVRLASQVMRALCEGSIRFYFACVPDML